MKKSVILSIIVCILLISSCGQRDTACDDLFFGEDIHNDEFHTTLPSGLMVDIYPLTEAPETEPYLFIPAADISQEDILSIHAAERIKHFPDNSFFDGKHFGLKADLDGSELLTLESYQEDGEPNGSGSMVIEVKLDDVLIYKADAGHGSPIPTLRSLWTSGRDWFLEYAFVQYIKTDAFSYPDATGHLVKNGTSLNDIYAMDEAFGFQLLGGKPFYFFLKDEVIGISYDGQDLILGFDEVLHYGCCSAIDLNPNPALNMVSFFAQKGDAWYYGEIGIYE